MQVSNPFPPGTLIHAQFDWLVAFGLLSAEQIEMSMKIKAMQSDSKNDLSAPEYCDAYARQLDDMTFAHNLLCSALDTVACLLWTHPMWKPAKDAFEQTSLWNEVIVPGMNVLQAHNDEF